MFRLNVSPSSIKTALLAALLYALSCGSAYALDVRIALLRLDTPTLPPISRLDKWPSNLGFAGAKLADEDNQTTGRFIGVDYQVEYHATTPDQAQETLEKIMASGTRLIVVMAETDDLLGLSAYAGDNVLLLNTQATNTGLRDANCRGNILHIIPSRAMLADAVTQFLIYKKWKKILLIHGSNPKDQALASAYRRAFTKFGAKLVGSLEFTDDGQSRRTDTGHALVQKQIPLFTQKTRNYDVIVAADESDLFAPYLSYHAWKPRPVLGSGGLRPVTLHPAHEAWGATQFQRRFERQAGRYVREQDYNAWLALRVIGEAVTRTNSANPEALKAYILSDAFELAAFKGQKVTFRPWNGQLRQPIILSDGRITVTVSPQKGFEHRVSLLDTMGLDQPESACRAFITRKKP